MPFFASALSLFLVLNSIGNIPLFVALLSKYNSDKQRQIILRELLIALGILLCFNYFGNLIMELLGISQPIIGIAGGILLFIIAMGMIFPTSTDRQEDARHQEPFIVPLAIPLVAGPGGIAAVMVYSEQFHNVWLMAGIILTAWIPTLIILLLSSNIKRFLGQKGLLACQKLGGMIICLLAIQMLTSGAMTLLKETFAPIVNKEAAPLPAIHK
ncbi:MAG: MarC family protein [Rhabdochlamydiaceae bacterium]|nr:MarC family protein [Rhabdochlamydiaceae bacterium]